MSRHGVILSPEICIVVDHRITSGSFGGKADSLNLLEGSSPGHAKASVQDSTGVLDQGMYSQG